MPPDVPPSALFAAKAVIALIGVGVFAVAFAMLGAVLPDTWALGTAVVLATGALRA